MEPFLRTVFFIVFLPLSLFGFFTVLSVLFPKLVTKTEAMLQQMPGRSFGIGLVNTLFFLPIALALLAISNSGSGALNVIITLPALVLLAILLSLASFGLLSVVSMIGEKLIPDQTFLKRIFWGTLLLCLACALPFVGWFLLLPYVLIISIGSTILGYFQRNE